MAFTGYAFYRALLRFLEKNEIDDGKHNDDTAIDD